MTVLGPLGFLHHASAGGGGATINFLSTVSSSADGTAYAFSGVDLGTASAGRFIIIPVSVFAADPSLGATSLIVGGVTATRNADVANGTKKQAIYSAIVPTGATANISLSMATVASSVILDVYRATVDSTTPVDTASDTGSSVVILPDLAVQSGGIVVAASYQFTTGAVAATWTGGDALTLDSGGVLDGQRLASYHISVTSTTTTNDITACAAAASGLAVSWR